MRKFQKQINKCLADLKKCRLDNIKDVDNLTANDKKIFYQIIADLNHFEDKLIIEYEE
jgi:hypothetical protein